MPWYVYIVQCSDGSFYTGITCDLTRRVHEHNYQKAGAKSLRGKRPVQLIYSEEYPSRSEALQREYTVKKLTHDQKQKLLGI